MKVQFGAGTNKLSGFRNHDDEVDIRRPLPYESNTVDFVFAEHLTEHVSPPDGLRFLIDCHRILKPGGTVRICCPVLDRLDLLHARDITWGHGHLTIFNSDLLKRFVELAGFKDVRFTERKDCDSHWKVIGKEKDDLETCRVEGSK